jgi:hypothetical protein
LAETALNFAESDVPIERAPTMIIIEINPPMMAYSIAVAARWSDKNRRMVDIVASTNPICPNPDGRSVNAGPGRSPDRRRLVFLEENLAELED